MSNCSRKICLHFNICRAFDRIYSVRMFSNYALRVYVRMLLLWNAILLLLLRIFQYVVWVLSRWMLSSVPYCKFLIGLPPVTPPPFFNMIQSCDLQVYVCFCFWTTLIVFLSAFLWFWFKSSTLQISKSCRGPFLYSLINCLVLFIPYEGHKWTLLS